MTRVTTAVARHKRKKRILKMAKGQRGARSKLLRTAKESAKRALSFAYRDRKQKKRLFRRLWITRITAAVKENDISYSRFINGLKKAKVEIDRKTLSDLAVKHKAAFSKLVKLAKENLEKAK